ncbi:histidine kinase [Noviherbaspirillum cavernae]|uniref:histidine kinase n=1 Tax=Noviherbaspirillum cavernae TaxID=2320862 RepID=A0A418WYY4_9BURK|nr:sensor histidine kinase [Noviherbaspirillum cavernae]RJG05295.1 histidine kinase [Noviherbaspirillum cavernae]
MLFSAAMKCLSFIRPPFIHLPLILFVFAVLLPLSGFAQSALTLQSGVRQFSASGHMSLLHDAGGRMTADAAQSSDSWKALPGAASAGYTSDTIWLRLEVERQADAPQDWSVRFTNPLLDDVRLYRPDGAQGWSEQAAGENLGRSNWAVDARNVVFPVRMEAAGREIWLVRLQSKNAMSTGLEIWPRTAFNDFSRREYLYYGLYFGFYVLLIVLHAFFWRMTREAQSGWYLLYVSLHTLTELMTVAIPQQLFDMPVGVSDPLLGMSICCSLAVGVYFAVQQMELPAMRPRFSKLVLASACGVAAIGIGLILAGRFAAGMILVQQLAMLLVVVFISLSLWMLIHGHKPARFFLLAFGIFYAGVVVSFLRNMAVVPTNFWTNHAVAIGALLHMTLMSLRLNLRYDELRRDKEMAQAETVRAVRQLNDSLEDQVARRTAALQQEIAQRVQLEQELRKALDVERRIKEEQQDFVAMVSHEFRTPLAIITTTAQQIAKNLDAVREKTLTRCQNLRNAAHRMAALVDEYLTADRMEDSATAFKPVSCDPRQLIEGIVNEWPQGRISMSLQPLPAQFTCDKGLLQVGLRNLLSNADRHATSGQAIHVQAEAREEGARHTLCISVRNRGELIPEDEVPRLFQKYFRGRSAQHKPGAGLGLYLVKRIAEMHAGEVWLENDAATGSVTFSLLLPDNKSDALNPAAPAPASASAMEASTA